MKSAIFIVSLLFLSCAHYVKLDPSIPRDFEFDELSVDTNVVEGRRVVERTLILWYFLDEDTLK